MQKTSTGIFDVVIEKETEKKKTEKLGENQNNITKLKVKGLIERIGPDKGGYWKVREL